MLWFTVLAVWWCASAGGAVPATGKPFYLEAAHAQHFAKFKVTYNKQYTTPEEERNRYNAFKKNLATINELNANDEHAVYDINEEADLTEEEIEAKYIDIDVGTRSIHDGNVKIISPKANTTDPPEVFDWRDKGVIPKPRDRKNCNASYVFSIVANIESHYAMSKNKNISISVQQAIDCDRKSKGCYSGDPFYTCSYYLYHGFVKEEDYKYVGTRNKCVYDHKKVVAKVSRCFWNDVSEKHVDEDLRESPLSSLIDGRALQWYRSGILTQCTFKSYNYDMLLIGYGHENGIRYWTLQNSKGENWGEKGYVRIKRGRHCLGIGRAGTFVDLSL